MDLEALLSQRVRHSETPHHGLRRMPGSYFAAAPATFDLHIRLSYGEVPEDGIELGLAQLGRALASI